MIVGARVQVDLPEHYTHGKRGEVRSCRPEGGESWNAVLLDSENQGPRYYPDRCLIELEPVRCNCEHEIATGALKR